MEHVRFDDWVRNRGNRLRRTVAFEDKSVKILAMFVSFKGPEIRGILKPLIDDLESKVISNEIIGGESIRKLCKNWFSVLYFDASLSEISADLIHSLLAQFISNSRDD